MVFQNRPISHEARALEEIQGSLREASLSTAHEVLPVPADHGALVTNPPYGKRLDDPRLLARGRRR